MNGLQKYFHELHVAREQSFVPNGSQQRHHGLSSGSEAAPPVLSSDDEDELDRIVEESKQAMLTEREILQAQKARKEVTRDEAQKRHDYYLNYLKEISRSRQEGQEMLRKMSGTRRGSEERGSWEELCREVRGSRHRSELSVQESQAICEMENAHASAVLQKSMAMLGAEKYDVQSFMDRQKMLREQQVAEFTDAYRESLRQGPPGERHKSVATAALSFIRKAQALERIRQGERPDAATYHSLAGQSAGSTTMTKPVSSLTPRRTPRTATTKSASISTPRIPTQGRTILQPLRPLDSWELR